VDFAAERSRVAAVLNAADVEAVTLNPASVNPPCVVVGLPVFDIADELTGWLRTPVYVVAPGPATADAVQRLLIDLGAVTTALGDPPAVTGLGGLDAAGTSGYTVTSVHRAARNVCP
jgi:hypothetical protein